MSEVTEESFQDQTTADGLQDEIITDGHFQSSITDDQIQEVFAAYEEDGKLNMVELKNVLHLLDLDLTDEELSNTYHVNEDPECLTLDQFTDFIRESILVENIDFRQRCEECLREFVEDCSGTLTRAQMKILLTQRGSYPVSDEDAEALMDELDINRDGVFNVYEISKLMYPGHY